MFEAKAEIEALVQSYNAPEVARRTEYWNYLRERGETDGETLAEHLRRFAQIVHTGDVATEAELAALETHAGRPLPRDLRAFYREVGELRTGGVPVEIESVRRTLERLRLPADEGYRRLRSLSLVDRIHRCWGGSREEFEPGGGLLTRGQLEELDRRYRSIGWFTTDPGEEGHTYLYYDEEGRWGALEFHQDDEAFLDKELLPLLNGSPSRLRLEELLVPLLRRVTRPPIDEET